MAKLLFITGACSGLGQALAWRFYQDGYSLALAARRTEDVEVWATLHGLAADRYRVYRADVSMIDSIVAAGKACLSTQGLPTVVLACAGISVGVDTRQRTDLDVMAATFATNNIGTAATFHPFVEPMCRRGAGTLVGIGSVNGIRRFAGHGANCPSQAAVSSYCECLTLELRRRGARVGTIPPGYLCPHPTQARTPAFLAQILKH